MANAFDRERAVRFALARWTRTSCRPPANSTSGATAGTSTTRKGIAPTRCGWRCSRSRRASDLLVLEVTISIQTDLLDTHPRSRCRCIVHIRWSVLPRSVKQFGDAGSPPISVAVSEDHFTGVLLGPHDSPFTTNHSSDSLLRLRLFGDFLEKGVIRKARPWIVIDRSGGSASRLQLESWWKQLCGSPLPLTP